MDVRENHVCLQVPACIIAAGEFIDIVCVMARVRCSDSVLLLPNQPNTTYSKQAAPAAAQADALGNGSNSGMQASCSPGMQDGSCQG